MTAIMWMLIAVGGVYFLADKKFLHCAAFVLAVIFLRGAVGDFDPGRFIATHQDNIMQRYERTLEPSEEDPYRARISRHVK